MDNTDIKMKTNQKQTRIGILLVSLLLIFSGHLYAFGVSSAYYFENPLYIPPGEEIEGFITLRNQAGTENISVNAVISDGSEILELTAQSDVYTIPAGGTTIVNYKITIPPDAEIEKVYPINIVFTTITKSESGSFGFGTSIGQKFNVIVGTGPPPPEEELITPWRIGLGIGIIIIIIIIILIRRKKKH